MGRGEYAQVTSIDATANRITVELFNGTECTYDPAPAIRQRLEAVIISGQVEGGKVEPSCEMVAGIRCAEGSEILTSIDDDHNAICRAAGVGESSYIGSELMLGDVRPYESRLFHPSGSVGASRIFCAAAVIGPKSL